MKARLIVTAMSLAGSAANRVKVDTGTLKGTLNADSFLRIARKMNEYGVNFGKTGNPEGPRLPHWRQVTPQSNNLMDFTLQGPQAETHP